MQSADVQYVLSLRCCAATVLTLTVAAALAASAAPHVQAQPFTTSVAERCRTDLWNVNHIAGWQLQWPAAAESMPVQTAGERAEALRRWTAFPEIVDQEIATLKKGLREGFSAPRPVVDRVRNQIAGLVELSPADSPFWSPARRANDDAFAREWDALVRRDVIPSVKAFLAFLAEDYHAAAREEIGLQAVPGGTLCYANLVERWTTLDVSPEELRRIGEGHVRSLHEELDGLAGEHFGTTGEELLRRFREGTVPGAFESEEEVVEHARAAIRRAETAVPRLFARTPDAGIVVSPIPEHQADGAPAGYYFSPPNPGDDAVYLINTTRPEDRRLMSEAVAFHEAIPGHHLQMALGARGRPYNAGFGEGWAIYAERLAEEAGLYSTPLDRAGMLVKHLWAASRLIVDPAIHVGGWTRQEAVDYMREHTTLTPGEIEVEVDRYIALPGQSLSYVLGYLEIRRLRSLAERELGDGFDRRAFHDVVLREGFVTLPELAQNVRAWIESEQAEASTAQTTQSL